MTFRFWYFWEEEDRKIIGVGRWSKYNLSDLVERHMKHANMHENILLKLTYTDNCKVYFNNSTTNKIMLCNNNNSIFLFVIPFNPHSNFTANSLLFFTFLKKFWGKKTWTFQGHDGFACIFVFCRLKIRPLTSVVPVPACPCYSCWSALHDTEDNGEVVQRQK